MKKIGYIELALLAGVIIVFLVGAIGSYVESRNTPTSNQNINYQK